MKTLDKSFITNAKKYLDLHAIGQDSYKKQLILATYRFINYGDRTSILVDGPTGTGKTYIFRLLSDYIKEYAVATYHDVSRLTNAGFSGENLEDVLKTHRLQAGVDFSKKKSVLFFDEFDKICLPSYDGKGDNVNARTVYQIMNAISGDANIAGVDCSKCLIILAGAFEGIKTKKESVSRPIGFDSVEKELKENDIREDLLEYGMSKEVLGRIEKIVFTKKLSRNELKGLLLHPKNGVFSRYKKRFSQEGLEITFQRDLVDLLLDRVEKEDLGARSLTNVISSIIGDDTEFDMISEGYTSVSIDKNCLLNGEKPHFSKG